jgi:hypothetical protein
MDGQAWIEWHKKMFQNGAIWLDLVGLSWIKLDFLGLNPE